MEYSLKNKLNLNYKCETEEQVTLAKNIKKISCLHDTCGRLYSAQISLQWKKVKSLYKLTIKHIFPSKVFNKRIKHIFPSKVFNKDLITSG